MASIVTQQLQIWHKKGQPRKGSIPLIPVHKLIHVPSARLRKAKSTLSDSFKTGSDLEKTNIKREVGKVQGKYRLKFQEVGVDIEKHFHDCLQLSEIGKKTSLGLHLNYKFNNISNQAIVLEHDNCTKYQTNFDSNPGNRSSEAPKLPNN